MRHFGFTGTQRGLTAVQRERLVALFTHLSTRPTAFHHGDCIGADHEAWQIASRLPFHLVCHPPIIGAKRAFTQNHEEYTPAPYLERNHDIVNASWLLVATPGEMTEQLRSGTWATVRYARKRGIRIITIFPDGSARETKPRR